MKNLRTTILLLFALATTTSFSQSITDKKAIENSDFIFEGVVTGMDFVKNTNNVYSLSYSIVVKKVLKGEKKIQPLDTVEMISPMPENWIRMSDGRLAREPQMHEKPLSEQKGFRMDPKTEGVFLTKNNTTGVSSNKAGILSLESYSNASNAYYQITPTVTNHPETREEITVYSVSGFDRTFDSKEQFNSYLEEVKLPSLKGETIKKKDVEFLELEELNKLQYAKRLENEEKFQIQFKQRLSKLSENPRRAIEDITYQILNEEITGTTTKFYEFDVYANGSSSNTYIDNSAFSIQFNTVAFGVSLVLNNKVTITRAPDYNTTTYEDPNASATDDGINVFRFRLSSNYTGTSWNRPLLTTEPQPILHVKMQLLICAGSTGTKFVKTNETKNAAIYTLGSGTNPLTGTIYGYNSATCVQPATYTLCPPPKINSFSPAIISAGTGSILTIKGIGFGTVRGKGQVQFREANDGGATTVPYMNAATDYVSWRDNEIKVRIPSSVDTLNKVGHPGSGDFVVKRDDGLTAATNSLPPPVLKINYSVLDLIIGTQGTSSFTKIPFQHIDATNSISGDVREFYLDTSIINTPKMEKIVRKALRDWTCATGINWRIAGVVTQQGLVTDGKSVIYLDNTYTGSPLATTKSNNAATCVDAGTNTEFVYYNETDIALTRKFGNPLRSWFFDTTLTQNVPLNKFDFYAVILHELGHAHYITHVNTDDDLMYYASTLGPVTASNRLHIKRSEDATEGGIYTLEASLAVNNKNCPILPAIRIFPSNCPNAGLSNEASDIESIYLYPNPSEESINLSFELTENSNVSYSVYDISGKLILHQEMGDLSTGAYDKKIDLTSIASGAYVLTVRFDDRSESVRLIKQ